MNKTIENFVNNLSESIRYDFLALVKNIPQNDIYACALMIDSGYSSVTVCIGDKRELMNAIQNENITTLEEIAERAWTPSEWGISSYELNDSSTEKLTADLEKIYNFCQQKFDQEYFEQYQKIILTSLIYGFKLSEINNLIEKPIYQFIFSTDGSSIELENLSSFELNSSDMHEEFLKRWDKKFSFYP